MNEKDFVTHSCKNMKLEAIFNKNGKKIREHDDYCEGAFIDLDRNNAPLTLQTIDTVMSVSRRASLIKERAKVV